MEVQGFVSKKEGLEKPDPQNGYFSGKRDPVIKYHILLGFARSSLTCSSLYCLAPRSIPVPDASS
jgi:hypothetical protein